LRFGALLVDSGATLAAIDAALGGSGGRPRPWFRSASTALTRAVASGIWIGSFFPHFEQVWKAVLYASSVSRSEESKRSYCAAASSASGARTFAGTCFSVCVCLGAGGAS
jgi:hypothetical protein